MSKILCSYSSIEFQCEHFPAYIQGNDAAHPIFTMPLKKLWKYLPKWQAGELTDTDSYLLFLALLKSTDLVEFRTAAIRTEFTQSIIAANMESLYTTISKVITIKHPRFTLPSFVISTDTRNLSNIKHWLEVWNTQYEDFLQGCKDMDMRSRLERKEASLERLIKNPSIKPERYAHLLASWAAQAADFPEFQIQTAEGVQSCSEYWQSIIIKCYKMQDIIQIPEKDIVECLEHCEEAIDLGSIFSYHLFNALREGLESNRGFFGIGQSSFSILGSDDSVEASNLQLLIDTAPIAEPHRKDYPSEFAFLKARMKWSIAASQSVQSSNSNNVQQNLNGI